MHSSYVKFEIAGHKITFTIEVWTSKKEFDYMDTRNDQSFESLKYRIFGLRSFIPFISNQTELSSRSLTILSSTLITCLLTILHSNLFFRTRSEQHNRSQANQNDFYYFHNVLNYVDRKYLDILRPPYTTN